MRTISGLMPRLFVSVADNRRRYVLLVIGIRYVGDWSAYARECSQTSALRGIPFPPACVTSSLACQQGIIVSRSLRRRAWRRVRLSVPLVWRNIEPDGLAITPDRNWRTRLQIAREVIASGLKSTVCRRKPTCARRFIARVVLAARQPMGDSGRA